MGVVTGKYLALSGGVGGAKLALGLSHCLAAEQLLIVANTADDFEHLGLQICPDLDSVMYALAGVNDHQRGWGMAEESWQVMTALERVGAETWFQLGDRDLATHLRRTALLRDGATLGEATAALCRALGVRHPVRPMTGDPVSTVVHTADGQLPFQHYFVREQCRPAVSGLHFDGIEQARPQPEMLQWLADPALAGIIVCPSNPFVSVDPILNVPGVREALAARRAPLIAVSPIVGGAALKGPAAKMLGELGLPRSAAGVAGHYGELLDGFVLDQTDAALAESIVATGPRVRVAPTVMRSLADRQALAREVLEFAMEW